MEFVDGAGSIEGVTLVPPRRFPDRRGSLDVAYAADAANGPSFAQWNVVRSSARVLRGLHAHSRYDEVYVGIEGRMIVALKDARRRSPTFDRSMIVRLPGDPSQPSVVVPAGVLHGVYFETDAILCYGLSSVWSGAEEFNCRWDDPDLDIAWPDADPILSDRDRAGDGYRAMVDLLDARLP